MGQIVSQKVESRVKVRLEPCINNKILDLLHARGIALIRSNNEKSNPNLRKTIISYLEVYYINKEPKSISFKVKYKISKI